MRKHFLLKTMLLLCALVVGSGTMWGQAAVNTIMWSEDWTGATTATAAGDSYTPSANYGKGTYVYNSGTVSYTQSSNSAYVRNDELAGGTKPELLLSSGTTWTISGIPTGNASELTLTYNSNNTKSSVNCSTSGASISGSSKSYTITTNGAQTITLVFSCTGNTRIDDVVLKVKTAGSAPTTCVTPSFAPVAGAVAYGTSIAITSTTSGATIYYTMGEDPADPTTSSDVYDSEHKPTITAATTIKAIAVKEGLTNSAVGSASYTIKAPDAPTFNPAGGTVGKGSTVTLSSAEGTTIRYTTDGSTPSATVGTVYSEAITINENVTIKAVAYDAGGNTSDVTTATFTAFDGTVVTFDATSDTGSSPLSKDGVSLACNNGALDNKTEYRFYKSSTTTISVTTGVIKRIEFVCTSSNPASGFGTLSGFSTDGDNGVWSGSAKSVTFTASNKQVQATKINVFIGSLKPTTMSIETAFVDGTDIANASEGLIEGIVKYNDVALSPQPTVTYTSSDETVATVATNGTVTFKKKGETTLKASFAGNDEYEACEATYKLILDDTTPQNTKVEVTTNYEWLGVSSGSSLSVFPTEIDCEGITATISGEGTKTRGDDTYIRLYAKNTLTLTAPTGYYVTEVEFDHKTGSNTVTVNEGTWNSSTKTWTGSTSSVTFTIGGTSGNNQINGFTVTIAPVVTISETKYAAYCSPHKLDFTDSDVKAYKASVDETNGKVTLTKVDVVPANEGVVLYCETPGDYAIPVTTKAASDVTGNQMVGVLVRTEVVWNPSDGVYNYILQQGSFKKATESGGYLKANRAYLSTSYNVTASGARELEIVFDDDMTTGVEGLKNSNAEELKSYYNLAGQRVAQPTKGLYIVNGKKVVIK